MRAYTYTSDLPIPADEVYRWHKRPGALNRMLPPWKDVQVESHGGVEEGARALLRIHAGPFAMKWIAEHTEVSDAERLFRDRQLKGPFGKWVHTHEVEERRANESRLRDDVRYRLPLGGFGSRLLDRAVRKRLDRQFRYRHRIAAHDVGLHRKYAPDRPLRIAISGSNGLIGSELVHFLTAGGHEVYRLVRDEGVEGKQMPEDPRRIRWDYQQGVIDLEHMEGLDVVVHLAGESVLSPRWSRQKKMEIIGSRVRGTEHLARSLASLDEPPRALLSASAIGFYGNRDAEVLEEDSDPGDDGFLSALCQDWERASLYAAEGGIRTVQMRIGIVLSPLGGILYPLIIPFKWGLGGRYGGADQYVSWIGLDDVLGAMYHLMADDAIEGPVNITSPNPVKLEEFSRTLGNVLSRPVYLNMPPWLVRILLGEVADDAALMSVRAMPSRLQESGFEFLHDDLEAMLRHVLGRVE